MDTLQDPNMKNKKDLILKKNSPRKLARDLTYVR